MRKPLVFSPSPEKLREFNIKLGMALAYLRNIRLQTQKLKGGTCK